MGESMSQSAADEGNSDHTAALLARLSKKAGVQATLAIDQNTGAILNKTGSISFSRSSSNAQANGHGDPGESEEVHGIEEMAMMVWKFVQAAGGLVQALDSDDEVKLLRLRTKKHELVIVPDARYLLVVVHETPSA